MKGYLLDTNLLIALFWPSHEQHGQALAWFTRQRSRGWVTCPLTQAGFVRIVSNPAFSRDAVSPREAVAVLEANTGAKDHQFWPADLSFSAASRCAGIRLVGHQQVTDAYLLGLALKHEGVLATLDGRIGALLEPRSAAMKALEIVR